jgi:ribosomal protein S6
MKDCNEYLQHVNSTISKEIDEYAISIVFKESRYIFVSKESDGAHGYCTHCKCDMEFNVSPKHNSKIICPNCKSECIVKSTRYQRKSLVDRSTFLHFEKSVLDPDTIVGRGFYAVRDYSNDYRDMKTEYMEAAVYIFKIGEKPVMLKRDVWYYDKTHLTRSFWRMNEGPSIGHFAKTCSIYRFNTNALARYEYCFNYESLKKAIKNTSFKYMPLKEYRCHAGYYIEMLNLIELYSKYPIAVEQLTKVGLKHLVINKTLKTKQYTSIKWSGENIYKILKINKRDWKLIRNSESYISELFLKIYQINIKDKSNLSPEAIKNIEFTVGYNYESLVNILRYMTLKKAYAYISKQEQRKESSFNGVIDIYSDYLNDCKTLNFNLNDDRVLYPKNLIKAHQNTIRQVKVVANKQMEEKIKKRIQGLYDKYYFENSNFLIRPVDSAIELIEEGKALHHCVGTYGDKYANGKTDILVIRIKSNPEKQLCTMEVHGGDIIQVRAKYNEEPSDDVKEFVEAFKNMKLIDKKVRLTA